MVGGKEGRGSDGQRDEGSEEGTEGGTEGGKEERLQEGPCSKGSRRETNSTHPTIGDQGP